MTPSRWDPRSRRWPSSWTARRASSLSVIDSGSPPDAWLRGDPPSRRATSGSPPRAATRSWCAAPSPRPPTPRRASTIIATSLASLPDGIRRARSTATIAGPCSTLCSAAPRSPRRSGQLGTSAPSHQKTVPRAIDPDTLPTLLHVNEAQHRGVRPTLTDPCPTSAAPVEEETCDAADQSPSATANSSGRTAGQGGGSPSGPYWILSKTSARASSRPDARARRQRPEQSSRSSDITIASVAPARRKASRASTGAPAPPHPPSARRRGGRPRASRTRPTGLRASRGAPVNARGCEPAHRSTRRRLEPESGMFPSRAPRPRPPRSSTWSGGAHCSSRPAERCAWVNTSTARSHESPSCPAANPWTSRPRRDPFGDGSRRASSAASKRASSSASTGTMSPSRLERARASAARSALVRCGSATSSRARAAPRRRALSSMDWSSARASWPPPSPAQQAGGLSVGARRRRLERSARLALSSAGSAGARRAGQLRRVRTDAETAGARWIGPRRAQAAQGRGEDRVVPRA